MRVVCETSTSLFLLQQAFDRLSRNAIEFNRKTFKIRSNFVSRNVATSNSDVQFAMRSVSTAALLGLIETQDKLAPSGVIQRKQKQARSRHFTLFDFFLDNLWRSTVKVIIFHGNNFLHFKYGNRRVYA